jgi:acyl dehydratase
MDLTIGAKARSPEYHVTREEVLDFARKYDPQPFHLDDSVAEAHPFFGRLAASGWHTCAIVMRLTVDSWTRDGERPLGGAGIDQIRWIKPVYPGDTLTAEFEVKDVLPGKPRPGMRLVKIETTTLNQHGEPVMRHLSNVIFAAAGGA